MEKNKFILSTFFVVSGILLNNGFVFTDCGGALLSAGMYVLLVRIRRDDFRPLGTRI